MAAKSFAGRARVHALYGAKLWTFALDLVRRYLERVSPGGLFCLRGTRCYLVLTALA
jgi:hypothetical protein